MTRKNSNYNKQIVNIVIDNIGNIEILKEDKIDIPKTKKQMTIDKLINSEIGIIYFICDKNDNYVRIGKTKDLFNLYNRFRKHQSGSPIELYLAGIVISPDYHHLDKQLASQFRLYHSHSDWFSYSKPIRNYVDENCLKLEYRNTFFPKNELDDIGY